MSRQFTQPTQVPDAVTRNYLQTLVRELELKILELSERVKALENP